MRKFNSAREACTCAMKITSAWKNEAGQPLRANDLLGIAAAADENGTFPPNDPAAYYVVTDDGSVGVTYDGGGMVLWFASAARQTTGAACCPGCGARLASASSFCPECGRRVEQTPAQSRCAGCGAALKPTARFCPECGAPVSAPNTGSPAPQAQQSQGGVGYSNVIHDPAFLKGVNKGKRARKGCAFILFLAPIVIVPIYTHFSDGLEFTQGLLLGAGISLAILVISFLASLKERTEKPFDGVVERRYEKRVCRSDEREDDRNSRWEMHYFVVIRKDNGKKHTIEENDPNTSYSYLREGDRVRYHGKMGLLYPYEKYDKRLDNYVICAFCRTRAPIAGSTCPRCGSPLLK